jgi:hypothetical protein
MLILLWLACVDPEFKPISQALSAYDRGQAQLASGFPLRAAAAFSEAAAADPARPVLLGWQAWALDQAGDTQGAIRILDGALLAQPGASELRYNRAALRARTGMLEGAAADLRWLYSNDVVQPVEVGEDRDFLPLSTHTDFRNLVPRAQIQADLRGEGGSVLLGERFTLELNLVVRNGAQIEIEDLGEETGLLRHVRTVEDGEADGPLWTRRRVRIIYKAVAGGTGSIGPWLVKSGGTSTLTDRIPVEVVALSGRTSADSPSEASAVQLPAGLDEAAPPPWIGVVAQHRVARLGPRHSLSPSVASPPGPVYELWQSGQVRWRQVPLPAGTFRVMAGGKVVVSSD